MPRRLLIALLFLTFASRAEAKKAPKSAPPRAIPIATYPANGAGATYQLELQGRGHELEGHVVVHVMKDGKELARLTALDAPNGELQKQDGVWAIRPFGASENESPTLLKITPFALNEHEQGLLFWRMRYLLNPFTEVKAIGWAPGGVKKLREEKLSEKNHSLE